MMKISLVSKSEQMFQNRRGYDGANYSQAPLSAATTTHNDEWHCPVATLSHELVIFRVFYHTASTFVLAITQFFTIDAL